MFGYGAAVLAALLLIKSRWRAMGIVLGLFTVVLAWWFTIKPNSRSRVAT
jgi:hypothetical protein